MKFNEKVNLGNTSLKVGRLGITGNYGVSSSAMEEAFERGCNYFNLGYMLVGRYTETIKAIKNIVRKGKRDELVLGLLSYSHTNLITDIMLSRRLRTMGMDYTDVLILGYYNNRPYERLIKGAMDLKKKGLVKHLGITSHNRKLFSGLLPEDIFQVFHVRYNAVNSGAEQDVFPHLKVDNRPGIVSFTATKWAQLMDPEKMPEGEKTPTAVDCYRFVLSNPFVDVCMTGTRNAAQLKENLKLLETGPMSEEEMNWMRKIGDHVNGR
jgi:aryl-alcohol dehydrogenase-like predicted oxidoreductase